jgi:arginyl-tRNA synthetase
VTYVGKDIAYQMWKLGLLDRQFGFERFHTYEDGQTVWTTTSATPATSETAPAFGEGQRVYNVIDARQAYLQDIVQRGVALLASEEARARSHHFSYEMVALTPATCRELGFLVSPEEESKPYLEVSGRRGLGVKADDLLQALEDKALAKGEKRNAELDVDAQRAIAQTIARGAVRYFMIKYTKNKVIAFDFEEALAFDGDSGPYLQYAAVRAAKILEKVDAASTGVSVPESLDRLFASVDPEEAEDVWALAFGAAELASVVEAVVRTEEPAHLAHFALALAQQFNGFYHRYHIASEPDETKRALRLLAVQMFYREHTAALGLMGIPVPARM